MIILFPQNIVSTSKTFCIEGCANKIPDTCKLPQELITAGITAEQWKCSLFPKKYCEKLWSESGACDTTTSGRVKDTCRGWCDNCGKYIISFIFSTCVLQDYIYIILLTNLLEHRCRYITYFAIRPGELCCAGAGDCTISGCAGSAVFTFERWSTCRS